MPGFSDIINPQEEPRKEARKQIERLALLLEQDSEAEPGEPDRKAIAVIAETDKEQYMAMVRRAKEYIAAGDIFQANLSLRLSADIGDADPLGRVRDFAEAQSFSFCRVPRFWWLSDRQFLTGKTCSRKRQGC